MTRNSYDQLAPAKQALIDQARDGQLSPIEFCKGLQHLGVGSVQQMLCLKDTLGLSLLEAKEVVVKMKYGSVDSYSEELIKTIDELSESLNPLKDERK